MNTDNEKELISILKKYHDSPCSREINQLADSLDLYIRFINVCQDFGVPIPTKYNHQNPDNFTVSSIDPDCLRVLKFSDKSSITCSDDGRQPEDGEVLLVVSFSTGAYRLSSDYPTKTFNAMFERFKEYEPKYSDTANHSHYYEAKNARAVLRDYEKILSEFKGKVSEEVKAKRISALEQELATLKTEG